MLTHVKYRLEKNLNERAVFVLFASDRFRSDMIFQQKCKSERLFSRSSRVNSRMVTLGDLTHGNGWARLLPNGGHECRVAGRSGAWAEPAALSLGSSVLPGDRLATAPRVRARPESPLGRLGGSFRRSLRCRGRDAGLARPPDPRRCRRHRLRSVPRKTTKIPRQSSTGDFPDGL